MTSSSTIQSICTECEPYYEIDSEGCVVPLCEDNGSSQDSQNSECSSIHNPVTKINRWSEANLFTLNFQSDHDFETFMMTLTKIEFMCITPLLISINIYRCNGSGVPASHGGTIAYPLKTPMEANSLPWCDFKNLPFIIVYRQETPEKYQWEAKIDLRKLRTAKEWMTKKVTYRGQIRSLNRLVDLGFMIFTEESFKKLQEELDEYQIPREIKRTTITEEEESITEPISKELFITWLKSEYHFAKAIHSAINEEEVTEHVNCIENFWKDLKDFSLSRLKIIIQSSAVDSPEVRKCQEWLKDGTYVTIKTLREYAEHLGYLNRVVDLELHNPSYHIFEEFIMLKQKFSNDLGVGRVDFGGAVQSAEEHPDDIVAKCLEGTVFDRRPLEVDKKNPAPEWVESYHQRAFPGVFLTGDAAIDQPRSVSLRDDNYKDDSAFREKYTKYITLQERAQQNTQLLILNANLLRRLDAFKGGNTLMNDLDITTINLPTREQISNDLLKGKTGVIFQYTPLIRDSKAFWSSEKNEALGVKLDLEFEDHVSRTGETPTYASHFRTFAPPYTSAPYIHKLLAANDEDLRNPLKRRQQALRNPVVVAWVISFLAELDLCHLVKERYDSDLYLGRIEHGANGNPHWHSVLYSKAFGKLCSALKKELTDYLAELIQEKRDETPIGTEFKLNEEDRESINDKIREKYESTQECIIDFFAGTYTNWNPCYTHDGKLTYDLSYETCDISTVSLPTIIHDALVSGDFSVLDKLHCDIIYTSCRHITHNGLDGPLGKLPSKKDYCYRETIKADKEKSTKEKKAYKVKVSCKRRKPQPTRSTAAIYRDPHDKKFTQLSFPCNDGSFNGSDPFLILNCLGNADTKAIIPSAFTKCPIIVEVNGSYILRFYQQDTNEAVEYVLKYTCKPPIPTMLDSEIMKYVLLRNRQGRNKQSKNNEDNNDQNIDAATDAETDTLQPADIYSMYNQAAVQQTVCIFMAAHLCMNLPLVNYLK